MALLLSRIILPELASIIYDFALQKHIDEMIECKCFIVPLIIEKNYNEYKLSNAYVYSIEYLLQDIVEAASIGQTAEIIEHEGRRLMSINTFRILGKVWDSEKMPIREMICLFEKHSRKK